MLHAWLKGIENKHELPEPTEGDVYHSISEGREKIDIENLPCNPIEAIEIA